MRALNLVARAAAICAGIIITLPCSALAEDKPELDTPEQQEAPRAFAADKAPEPQQQWGVGQGKSWFVPAADIFVFEALVNVMNRKVINPDMPDYHASWDSFEENLHRKWVYDNDPFSVNQFGHPYQGSWYHGFARSAGLGYWPASAYTMVGSALWEVAGETTPPSINDQITTGLAGSFLGEPLFRMASLLLESADGKPGFWREVGALAISPSTGINRLVFGNRFDGVFASHDPAVYTRFDLGYNAKTGVITDINTNPDPTTAPVPQSYQKGEAVADFTIAYGLPGKPGYTYARPFDYFHFQFTAITSNAIENVMVRGLLAGTDYAWGENYRGIWGVYGVYDYIAPELFRVSNTGAGLGTTAQWWMTRHIALQGTALGAVGYGSAGTIHGAGGTDYHHGLTPQALGNLRLIFGDRVSFDITGRNYYVSGQGSAEEGAEYVSRTDAALTWRVKNLHGITLKYTTTHRDAHYDTLPDTNQRVGAISIGYTLLGQTRSGAVDWRAPAEGGPGAPDK